MHFFVLSVEIKKEKKKGINLSPRDLTNYSVHLFQNSKKNFIIFFQQAGQKMLFT